MKTTLILKHKAFTILELIVIVSLAGVVAVMGVVSYAKVQTSVKEQKLKNDQATLNSSINVYRGFGGSVEGLDDPNVVILKLKKVALASEAKTIPGLSGSMLDPRVTPEWQSDEEAASAEPRLHWNPDTMLFDFATSGPPGIRKLLLNDQVSHVPDSESREVAFTYADDSTWIWDFDNEQRQTWVTPTLVQVTPEPVSLLPEGSDPDDPDSLPDPGPAALTLEAPTVSHESGAYSIRDYALPVAINNPNPEDTSKIFYSVDYGTWTPYTATLALAPDATIQTMAVANEVSEYNNSSMVTADYSATSVNLTPPAIQTTIDAFGVFSDHEVGVSITDSNITDPSTLEYRIDDGAWAAYEGSFTVTRQNYPAGLDVEARAIAAEGPYSEYYTDSSIATHRINADVFTVTATSSGGFHHPYGSLELLTNIHDDQRKAKVMWGNQFNEEGVKIPGRAQSWLEFAGNASEVTLGERVDLGTLDFYNGSHGAGTGADGVGLELQLALNVSGVPFEFLLNFDFLLNNVSNDADAISSDPDLARTSADYVEMAPSSKVRTVEVNGFYYQIVAEFGDVEGEGFANFDQFHVLETESASTKLYGTFLAIPASEFDPNPPVGND